MVIDPMMRTILEFAITIVLAEVPAFGQTQAPKGQERICPPFSLSMITDWLDRAKRDPQAFNPDTSLVGRLNKCGISFDPTNETKNEIQKHGGSAKLLGTVERATRHGDPTPPSPPPPPPPPPPKPTGQLTVTCRPVDCSVSVGESPIGSTVENTLSRTLDVGPITVTVARADYDPDKTSESVVIKEGETARVEFKLKPSPVALDAAGAKAFQRMIDALGGDAGLKASSFLRGTGGTLNAYRDGKPTAWDIKALIKTPDRARFSIRKGGQSYEVAQTSEGLVWQKQPKSADGDDLDLPLRMLQQYQIAEVIGRLRGQNFKIIADRLAPVPGQDIILHATNGNERILITLDPDLRPKEFLLESAGLSSGRKINYSAYIQKGSVFYPRSLQVILPGAAQNGFELKFLDVELNPADVNDADFTFKKSGRHPKNK